MKMEVRKNRTRQMRSETRRAFDRVVERSANRILSGAQERIVSNGSVDTGNLLNSGQVQKPRELRRTVGFSASYAADVEYGTQAHDIRPRQERVAEYEARLAAWQGEPPGERGPRPRPPALFWPSAGHPVAVVHHPGTHPKPFLRPAFDAEKPKLREDLRTVEKDLR